MSKYAQFPTSLTEGSPLVEALRSLGYDVATSATPQPCNGYQGSQGQTAEIIVSKKSLIAKHGHCFGDIGFTKTADGTYKAIIDDLDQDTIGGDGWMNRLKQEYTAQRQIAVGRMKGYTYQGREVVKLADGREQVRLQFKGR
jgi:hypothetical protein